MNNPQLILNRLEELVAVARTAQEPIAKAAVFAAVRVITADLDAVAKDLGHNQYMLKKTDEVRWSIGALVGYAATNDMPAEHHVDIALSGLTTLRNFFSK